MGGCSGCIVGGVYVSCVLYEGGSVSEEEECICLGVDVITCLATGFALGGPPLNHSAFSPHTNYTLVPPFTVAVSCLSG